MRTFKSPGQLDGDDDAGRSSIWKTMKCGTNFKQFSDGGLLNSNDSHESSCFVCVDVRSKSCLQTSAGN